LRDPGVADRFGRIEDRMRVSAEDDIDIWNRLRKFAILTVADMGECDNDVDLRTKRGYRIAGGLDRVIPKVGARGLGLHSFGHHGDHDAEDSDPKALALDDDEGRQRRLLVFRTQIGAEDRVPMAFELGPKRRRKHVGLSVSEHARITPRIGEPLPRDLSAKRDPEISGADRVPAVEVEGTR